MSIQNDIYNYIDKAPRYQKFTSMDISSVFDISRNTASHHLNRLVETTLLVKENTRPTKFYLDKSKRIYTSFEKLIGYQGSMKTVISKCKSAVLYPNGVPIIIRGNSGTGKSYLAKLIYEYAQEKKQIDSDAPFIILNCADYSNNPELLSSILFGYVEGAFTGAQQERRGLLDEADGGYLFLDEVHNLSSENQEKLFLLIDSQKYRRLGESEKWLTVNVRLILATTEDTDSVLLTTFRRRIPLEIKLPDYSERSLIERNKLIHFFFQKESKKIGYSIAVKYSLIRQLENQTLIGNVGELKNKIMVLVADAYVSSQDDLFLLRQTDILPDDDFILFTGLESPETESVFIIEEEIINIVNQLKNFIELKEEISKIIKRLKCIGNENNVFFNNYESIYQRLGGRKTFFEITKICRSYGCKLADNDQDTLKWLLIFFHEYDFPFHFFFPKLEQDKIYYHKYFRIAQKISAQISSTS